MVTVEILMFKHYQKPRKATLVLMSVQMCVSFLKGLIQECTWYKIINSKNATRTL